jgi:predicted MFS family arabinose efflux permease
MLVLARVLMGAAAGGVIPLSIATIAEKVPFAERQPVLAKLLSYTLMGLIGGSWAGGFIADVLSWRTAFVVMSVVFAGVGLGVQLRMACSPSVEPSSYRSQQLLPGLRSLASSAWSRTVLLTTFVEGAVVFGVMTFIPTLLHLRFDTPLAEAGASLAFFGLGGLLYTRLARHLLARLGQPKLAALGSALLALSFGTFAVMPAASWSVPASLGAGLGFYMLHNTLQTCATQLSAAARGSAISLFVFLFFLVQSMGVTLEGLVIQQNGMAASHVIAATVILFCGVLFSRRLAAHLAKE